MVFDAGTHFVVLEVDEHQHKFSGYSCDCEQVRMVNITQTLQLPTIFIRYNPDTYKPGGGGGSVVREKQRLYELVKVLTYFIQRNVDDICAVVYLFYDGHTSLDCTKVHRIN